VVSRVEFVLACSGGISLRGRDFTDLLFSGFRMVVWELRKDRKAEERKVEKGIIGDCEM
jgi:hypothetical protein